MQRRPAPPRRPGVARSRWHGARTRLIPDWRPPQAARTPESRTIEAARAALRQVRATDEADADAEAGPDAT
ncbi:MAG: hypothetical protein QOF26_1609 [Baekduia sp.]|nr:hypothetical protein [Baekduia sp.]